jgi:hypothetical protein
MKYIAYIMTCNDIYTYIHKKKYDEYEHKNEMRFLLSLFQYYKFFHEYMLLKDSTTCNKLNK